MMIKYLGNIFKSERFQKFIKSLEKQKNLNFGDISEKIEAFASQNSQLEGIMLSYYYICHSINYDYKFSSRNID